MKGMKEIYILGALLLVLWSGGVILAEFLPHDPYAINLRQRLLPPGGGHILGTDHLGRDIFSRVVLGYRNTISVSVMAFATSFVIGSLIGGIAGFFYQTFLDDLFNWICALIFSLPFLLIIASLLSLMPKSLVNAYLVLTGVMWVGPARIVRTGVIQIKDSPFITMEKSMGKTSLSIFTKTLIPMSIRPAFTYSFRYFPEIIGLEAGFSFLGLGVQPPEPGLGKMIFTGMDYLSSAWWYAASPAFCIFFITFAAYAANTAIEKSVKQIF